MLSMEAPVTPQTEEMFQIRPRPAFRRYGIMARLKRNILPRLASSNSPNSASETSCSRLKREMPPLFTSRISSSSAAGRLLFRSMPRKLPRISPSISPWTARHSVCSASTAHVASSRSKRERQFSRRRQPSSASASAMAFPTPRDAPVMTADFIYAAALLLSAAVVSAAVSALPPST